MENLLRKEFNFQFEPELLSEIEACGTIKSFEPQEMLMESGQSISHIPLILSGAIKVFTEDENGDELLLYYLEKGDTCAMTLKCCTGNAKSKIAATTDESSNILFIPVEKMDEWMATYASWRNFVLNSHHTRMTELLEAVDSLAFLNMEERLEKYLKDKVLVSNSPEIEITHAEIAGDLNSSRVVVSRLMKKLERDKKVVQRRNLIELSQYK